MKRILAIAALSALAVAGYAGTKPGTVPSKVEMSKEVLLDKVKGGWAGQTIGVVYGAPVEFKFTGTTIQDYQPIPWGEHYIKYWWDKKPGLFDDIYNDLTFVETLDREGLDCSADTLARRFAFADYHLAHANQAARYNIRNGVMPPQSGYWMNNPHADDIDFQIESDFIGLMTPGLMPEAMEAASRIGHIMNSGDGFYGGAFTSGLYSAAFVSSSPAQVLDLALAQIPVESQFYQCIDDVRKLHERYPDDWQQCWFEIHKKWNRDVGCPKGVFLSFNIDAKINSAYVAIGLLYGGGDFSKSVEIATRCGQDADCNPSTVAGVLGVMYGYSAIPAEWLDPLKEIENLQFVGTDVSLADAYGYSYKHALENIRKAGGEVTGKSVVIPQRKAEVLPLEQNFTGMYPYFRDRKDCFMDGRYDFDFDGNGFVIWGNICCLKHINKDYINRVSTRHIGSEVFGLAEPDDPYVAVVEIWIDGKLDSTVKLPMKATDRRVEPAWKYLLPEGLHHVELNWINPDKNYTIRINDIVYYSERPVDNANCDACKGRERIAYGATVGIDKAVLLDKIKGGWAGQTIGCTYGGPTEFKYKGALINDKAPIVWYEDYIYDSFKEDPGLFDDVYMDLTFLETMDREGLDAPAKLYADAFANADYKLWHANQAARYNILNGVEPPQSGFWKNNPHADDIDFQIESDFIGMICPGMPLEAAKIADRIGHITNYGDGWYGGVYFSTVYSLAFVCDDIPLILSEALKAIPEGTKYRNCIEDVISFHKRYPDDWKQCWLEIEKRHGYDIGCPEGVFNGFDIDAVINSAYVVMGLLYGEGDFFKTMDIATRCGQDSDCNPSSALGILGVVRGFDAIPEEYKKSMSRVQDIDFAYTDISLNKVYAINGKLIEDVLAANGGGSSDDGIRILLQKPAPVAREVSFEGLRPSEKRVLKKKFNDELVLDFDGSSVIVLGQITQVGFDESDYVAEIQAFLDGKLVEEFKMPFDYIKRKYDIFYRYGLSDGKHTLKLEVMNPRKEYVVEAKEMVVYKNENN